MIELAVSWFLAISRQASGPVHAVSRIAGYDIIFLPHVTFSITDFAYL
jgi:F0F1-type ATP synthase assembly protein I